MKAAGIIVICISVLLGIVMIVAAVRADYEYDRTIASYWSLSVKASTLQAKADYLDKFVGAIQSSGIGGNNAVFFKTPDNSYEQNLAALQSLQQRMHEIRAMDVTSFQYQQAIAQITAQEQDEGGRMLGVFEGCWYKSNHLLLWDWVSFLIIIGLIVLLAGGIVLVGCSDSY